MTFYDESYQSLLPILIVNVAFSVLFLYYAVTYSRRPKTPEVLERLHRSFLGVFFLEFWYWFIDPAVKFLAFLRMTPNMITAMSIVISAYTAYVFLSGSLGFAGWLVIISGTMDLLDGRLARSTGQTTRSGAFFDACTDRFNDAIVFAGAGLYFIFKDYDRLTGTFNVSPLDLTMLIVAVFLIIGTEVMSYSKARGEVYGFVTKRGLMQRPERVALMGGLTVLYPYFRILAVENGVHPDISLMITLAVMAVLVNYSAVIRIIDLFRKIREEERNRA